MSIEENKELVRRFYAAIERKDFDALRDFCHAEFVFYSQLDTPHPGVDGFIGSEKKNFEAFESFRFPIEAMIAEDDKVAVYLVFEGKNQIGECAGVPPNGMDLRFSLLMLLTIADGKIIEKRAHFDRLDVRTQLAG